jgi:hypothetical protein
VEAMISAIGLAIVASRQASGTFRFRSSGPVFHEGRSRGQEVIRWHEEVHSRDRYRNSCCAFLV